MKNYIASGAALTAMALALCLAPMQPAQAGATDDELRLLRQQMTEMLKRMEELENRQVETEVEIEETRESAVITSGRSPGSFILPGSDTTIEISGYIKTDLIFDASEGLGSGDIFAPESISTSGNDEQRFRAHAKQSRLRIKTSTPTDWGPLKTLLEGDFFGAGGNQILTNSTSFRLRHAYASIGGLSAGQFWSNFMPIASYSNTIDFNGPAGTPFVRQAQLRYTHQVNDNLSFSGSLENSEFSGRNAAGTAIGEGRGGLSGTNAGIDKAPDVTAAVTYKDDWGLVKLAGLGRYLGSPNNQGDGDLAYGINLSGNAKLWPGGTVRANGTFGDGVGRYIINGAFQDGFVDADGDVHAIEAFGFTAQVQQQLTDTFSVAVAYGRAEFNDSRRPSDLDTVQTIHGSLFWSPIERLTFGAEVIWGKRKDAGGANDDAIRLQTSMQVNF